MADPKVNINISTTADTSGVKKAQEAVDKLQGGDPTKPNLLDVVRRKAEKEAIEEQRDAMKELGEEARNAGDAVDDIFNLQALTGAVSVVKAGYDWLRQYTDELNKQAVAQEESSWRAKEFSDQIREQVKLVKSLGDREAIRAKLQAALTENARAKMKALLSDDSARVEELEQQAGSLLRQLNTLDEITKERIATANVEKQITEASAATADELAAQAKAAAQAYEQEQKRLVGALELIGLEKALQEQRRKTDEARVQPIRDKALQDIKPLDQDAERIRRQLDLANKGAQNAQDMALQAEYQTTIAGLEKQLQSNQAQIDKIQSEATNKIAEDFSKYSQSLSESQKLAMDAIAEQSKLHIEAITAYGDTTVAGFAAMAAESERQRVVLQNQINQLFALRR